MRALKIADFNEASLAELLNRGKYGANLCV